MQVNNGLGRRCSLVWNSLPLIRAVCQSLLTGRLDLGGAVDETQTITEPESELLTVLLQNLRLLYSDSSTMSLCANIRSVVTSHMYLLFFICLQWFLYHDLSPGLVRQLL